MNHKSVEYGILISGCTYQDLRKTNFFSPAYPNSLSLYWGGKGIETHPADAREIFISYGKAEPGIAIPVDEERKTETFQALIGNLGKATWGIIHTER